MEEFHVLLPYNDLGIAKMKMCLKLQILSLRFLHFLQQVYRCLHLYVNTQSTSNNKKRAGLPALKYHH
jgi:hypothetical protein